MATSKRCQGRRRKWRGHVFGTFACGRKATWVGQTYVGLSRTVFFCDDPDCYDHLRGGYQINNARKLDGSK